MKKFLITTLLALSPITVSADAREDTIEQLMEAQGLLSMFENQLEMNKVHGEKIGQQMLQQLMGQLKPSPEYQKKFTDAFTNFLNDVSAPWGADEIVKVWSQYYGEHFTDEELKSLLTFYTSELGQKEVRANGDALQKFTIHFQKLGEPILQETTQAYIDELKLIAKECNCRR